MSRSRLLILAGLAALPLCLQAQGLPNLHWIRGGTPYGVNDLDYSPDGALFATAGDDHSVKIFRTSDAKLVRNLLGAVSNVYNIEFSPDGSLLATAEYDGTVRIWRVSDSQVVRSWTADSLCTNSIAFSPDGTKLASVGYDQKVHIWNLADGAHVRAMPGHTDVVYDVEYSPDGTLIATTSDDESVRLWDANTGALVRSIPAAHDWFSIDVDFSPDGTRIATTGGLDNPSIKVWTVATGALVYARQADTFSIGKCEWTPNGQLIFTVGRWGIKKWDAASGALLDQAMNSEYHIAMSPRGDQFALSGGAQSGAIESESVYQRRVSDLSVIRTVNAHTSFVSAARFSPDGAVFVTGCGWFESSLRIWDSATGAEIRRLPYSDLNDGVLDLEFTPDGSQVGASGGKGWGRLWDVQSGSLLQTYPHGGIYPTMVFSIAFHPTQSLALTSADDRMVKVWDKTTAQLVHAWQTPANPYALDFSPDGSLLAVGINGGVALYDGNGFGFVRMATGHGGQTFDLHFLPDGQRILAANSGGTVRLLAASDLTVLRTFAHGGALSGQDVSPDGSRLITCDMGGTVKVWDVEGGAPLRTYNQQTEGVRKVAIASDNHRFGYGRDDGSAALGDLDLHGLAETMSLTTGVLQSGGVSQLQFGDGMFVALRPGPVMNSSLLPIMVVVEGTSPLAAPQGLRLRVESVPSMPTVMQKVELFNWSTSTYEQVSFGLPTAGGQTFHASGDLARFIRSGDRRLRARVGFGAITAVGGAAWSVRLDEVRWMIRE